MTRLVSVYSITGGEPTTKFNGVYLEQSVEKGTVSIHLRTYIEQVHKVDTTEERADIFTKAMSTKAIADYFKFRNDIMNIKHANA